MVTFTLTPLRGGTQLVLEHTGFSWLRGLMVSSILGQGWRKKILPKGLPAVIQRIAASS